VGALSALALAVALSGCANIEFDSSQGWFSKPLDVLGRGSGYTVSDLRESRKDRPITAADLVDGNGACAAPAAVQPTAESPGANPAPTPDGASLLGGGISLGMSECDVVHRAGQPTAVQLGRNPNGDRTAVMTFNSGPRPGVYRFEGGRLMQMDRAEVQPPAPAAPKTVKKKPAKPQQAATD
jgi:hypothetical protein